MSINLAKLLKSVHTVVTHDNCPDGIASAILLRDALPKANIVFALHGTEAYQSITPQPGYLFADIVPYVPMIASSKGDKEKEPDLSILKAWVDSGSFVLDHHRSVKAITQAFVGNGTGAFGDEKENPGVCGAVLVYEHIWLPYAKKQTGSGVYKPANFAGEFARLSGIRDTYQKLSPDFAEASLQAEALMFFRDRWPTMSLEVIANVWNQEIRPTGKVLMAKNEQTTARIAAGVFKFKTNQGTRVAVFNDMGRKSSDVTEALADTADIVVGFSYIPDEDSEPHTQTKLIFATRSYTGYDCASLAANYGGGGHTAAAGFSRLVKSSDSQPFEMIRQLIEMYEWGG